MSSTKKLTLGIGITVVVLTLAAVGIAQQDGLQPPPGPVTDTQPSLFTLGEAIANIQSSLAESPANELFYAPAIAFNSTVTLNVGHVRIERIIVNSGVVSVKPQGVEIARFAAGAEILSDGAGRRLEPFTSELGIEVEGPIEFTGTDSFLGAAIIVVYRELP